METLQVTLASLAILIVRFVMVQVILSVQPVMQGTFCIQHLCLQQRVTTLVRVDIGRILQITFAHLVILLVQLARMVLILHALPVERGIFCNCLQQHV